MTGVLHRKLCGGICKVWDFEKSNYCHDQFLVVKDSFVSLRVVLNPLIVSSGIFDFDNWNLKRLF